MAQLDLELAATSLTESIQLSLATGQRLAIARGIDSFAALAVLVAAMRAAPAPRHQAFNPLPLRIAQPIELLPHQGLLDSETLNHNSSRAEILIEYRP